MDEITQDTATLNLLMNREVDKRVALALHRALIPTTGHWREQELEKAYDTNNQQAILNLMRGLIVETVLSDGALMNTIRRKLAEQLNPPY